MPRDISEQRLPRTRARFERLDARFRGCDGDEWLDQLYTGGRWLEGIAYFPASRSLVFSDVPDDRLLRWDELTGAVGVFRQPSGFANGNLADRAGRLVTCEQGTRRVTRTEPDGTVVTITDSWRGLRYNSPDVVVEHSDGSLWFSDPSYGIDSDYEGVKGIRELDRRMVFRVDPVSGSAEVRVDTLDTPNGLAFDEPHDLLYVTDCGPDEIHRYRVRADSTLDAGTVFAVGDTGPLDGLAVDDGGRVWAAAGDGVDCYHPDGTRLARLHLDEPVACVAFGGPRRNDLFIAATSTLHRIRLKVRGVAASTRDTRAP